MFEPIADMPAGTLGFRAGGRLTSADYSETLVPALRQAIEAGSVRLLLVVEELEKLDLGKPIGRAKEDLSLRSGAWKRTALVTDVGWLRAAIRPLGRFAPGELRLFGRAEEDEARTWVAA
jgi:hypothetical protein